MASVHFTSPVDFRRLMLCPVGEMKQGKGGGELEGREYCFRQAGQRGGLPRKMTLEPSVNSPFRIWEQTCLTLWAGPGILPGPPGLCAHLAQPLVTL